MPFKSKAQVRKFAILRDEGKISEKTFDEWARKTDFSKLPARKLSSTYKRKGRKVPEGIGKRRRKEA